MVLKELPVEIWRMVAKELKREPPPPNTKANWNDHFHQQDLVNLQRVSKVRFFPNSYKLNDEMKDADVV
jgi:hypothetical protein